MLLAHDLGTTGDKASLHDDDGRLLAATVAPYPTVYGPAGVAEQDPEAWWQAFCAATGVLLAGQPAARASIRAVGLSGQMMGAVFLGAGTRPVCPAIIWADSRSRRECDLLVARVGMKRAYDITGHRLDPTYSLAKIMWLRRHRADIFRDVRRVCLAKDFIVHRLTGALVTDPSDASSTNAFDQHLGTWSGPLLAAAELDPALFPPIVPSAAVTGEVTAAAARECGLRAGTPVVAGGGDGPLAAVGTGVVGPGDGAYAYLGTSSWVSFAADAPVHDPLMRTMTFNHVVPGRFVPTATMQAGAGSLEWLAGILSPEPGDDRFAALVAGADTARAADDGLYFLPHLLGERSPYWDSRARGAFVGLARHHGREHLTRAVLEGVAFNLATCIQAFRDAGTVIQTIDAVGGGAVSSVWLQVLADVWGCVVRRRSIVEEANSLGAAVLAGVGAGILPGFGVARTLTRVTAEFVPDAARHAEYAGRHQAFLAAYKQLEPWQRSQAGQ